MPRRRQLLASLSALTLLALAAAARVGPPWISIEYPANPFDRESRDALLYVHAFHHGTALDVGVVGRAEGIVEGGARRTVALRFARTSRPGTYALRRQWPTEGTWMLVISTTPTSSDDYGATALVDLGADGAVTAVRVPSTVRQGWTVPTRVTAEEIESALRARAVRPARQASR